jgi:hypothetical protein
VHPQGVQVARLRFAALWDQRWIMYGIIVHSRGWVAVNKMLVSLILDLEEGAFWYNKCKIGNIAKSFLTIILLISQPVALMLPLNVSRVAHQKLFKD